MARKDIPDGFAVVQLSNHQWYPVSVDWLYSASHPEGFVVFTPLNRFDDHHEVIDSCFSSRQEAEHACQVAAHAQADAEVRGWEYLAAESNAYPDRCVHYLEVIAEHTGKRPVIFRFANEVNVTVWPATCHWCHKYPPRLTACATTIEDALEELAQCAYAFQCPCFQQHGVACLPVTV